MLPSWCTVQDVLQNQELCRCRKEGRVSWNIVGQDNAKGKFIFLLAQQGFPSVDAQLQTVLPSWKKPLLKFLFKICGMVVLVIDWMWRWESETTLPALKNETPWVCWSLSRFCIASPVPQARLWKLRTCLLTWWASGAHLTSAKCHSVTKQCDFLPLHCRTPFPSLGASLLG